MARKILRQSENDAIFRTAVPADPDAQWGDDAVRMLREEKYPGITVKEVPGDQPQHGVMVSIPGQEETDPSLPSAPEVRDYVHRHHDLINSDPDNYYGGWESEQHGVPRWFNDVSHRYDDPWQAAQDAVKGNQLAVYDYDDPRGEVKTPEFFNDQIAKGGARSLAAQGVGRQRDAVWTPSRLASLPDHDWTQHGLGDPDYARLARQRFAAAAAAAGIVPQGHADAFDPTGLTGQGGAGGSHGAQVFRNPNGEEWVIKQPPPGQEFLAHLDVAANQIAGLSGVDTPSTFLSDGKLVGLNPGPISAQVRFPQSKDAYPNKKFDPEKASDDDLLTIQKHHALDWLLSNHDSHPKGFVRLNDGRLAGIDKGQAFKYFGQDKLHWNFHPNQDYGETEPVYNTLYRNFATGGRQINDPRQGQLGEFLQHLQDLPDDQIVAALKPYADAACKQGALCHPWKHTGLVPGTVKPNDADAFVKAVLARKHALMHDFGDLYDRAMAHRMTGTKIARRRMAADPTLPLDWDGHEPNPQPLYRGAVLDLRGPDADQVRRSLLGNGNEDIYGPAKGRFAPCRGCPHPIEKIRPPKEGNGVQGAFPLGRDFSDYELATQGKGRWRQMGQQIAALLGHGDDTEWSDDHKTAEKNALATTGPLQLPVVLAQSSRPDGSPDIDSVRILHPQTGHWHEVMPGQSKQGRTAALPDENELADLQREFSGWYAKNGKPDAGGNLVAGKDAVRHWPHVEQFLGDRHPGAYSGSKAGEYARQAISGVDDKRTLANMVILHMRSQNIHDPADEQLLYSTPGMSESIVKNRNKMQQTAGYSVHLKLNDGTTQSYDADIFTRARALADQVAGKHGLEVREKDRSPDDIGRGTQYLPVYRNNEWAGNVVIERSDNHPLDTGADAGGVMGPHSDQYAYAARRLAYAPDPTQLSNLGKQMGTHGAQLWQDPQGQWLLKKPGYGEEFMIPLDVATSQLQQAVGLEGPEVHAVPMPHPKGGSYLVAAHRMYPGASQAWQRPPHLGDVHPDDLLTLQKHQAMDWLIANHDPHVGNFMRTPKGLVGVDKGQALKYFGRDRLDWNFHPNYYAREPVYNNLWREYAHGLPGEINDPREGELGDFITRLQSIPDDRLKEMFYPYATAAARVGMLATGGGKDPNRGLTYPRVKPNSPEDFLNALVERKNHLADDLGEMFDRAATHRASAAMGGLGGQPLPKSRSLKQKPPHPDFLSAPQYGPGKHEMPPWQQLPTGWDDEE